MKELMFIGLTLQLIGLTGLVLSHNEKQEQKIILKEVKLNKESRYECNYKPEIKDIICKEK